jgi:Uncharacterized protein conserved in bacteria
MKKFMIFIRKVVVPILATFVLVGCASQPGRHLIKMGTPDADTLASKTPAYAKDKIKELTGSIPSEYYFTVTDNAIDTLFKKENGKYEVAISIKYDSLKAQKNYAITKGDSLYIIIDEKLRSLQTNGSDSSYKRKIWNENGVLVQFIDHPNEYKEFWDNGKLKIDLKGKTHKCNTGFCFSKGHIKMYDETGNLLVEELVENDSTYKRQEWNESGVLIKEANASELIEYSGNGNKVMECKGKAIRMDDDTFNMDSAQCNYFYDDGKLLRQTNFLKNAFYTKEWNEAGNVIKQGGFDSTSKGEYREFWEDGTIKMELTGLLYLKKSPQDSNVIKFNVKEGVAKTFFENGNLQSQETHESKDAFHSKKWNENGTLIKEIKFPHEYREFWENGKIKKEFIGLLSYLDRENLQRESGEASQFYENGQKSNWELVKDRQIQSRKTWNEKGVLIEEIEIPRYIKHYYDDGTLSAECQGKISLSNGMADIKTGYCKQYQFDGIHIIEYRDYLIVREHFEASEGE